MSVRMHWRSVLVLVMPPFVFAVLNHSVSLAARQNQSQEEATSFTNVKETVSRLLSVPMYTASDEKLLNEAGDGVALAMTRIVSQQEMESDEIRRRILLILHLAFEAPQSIIEQNNKTPTAALRLVDQLQRTDYGRQPTAIGNARFEIVHNTSTGRPLEPVTLPGEPVIDWGHTQWLSSALAWIVTVKPGMTRSDLLRVFRTEGGLSTRTHRTYVLKQCPTIKVDVVFSISGNEAQDKITQISKPYLDYGHYD